MILEVDIGNTRLKWRVRDGQSNLTQGFIATLEPPELLTASLEPYGRAIKAVLVASVTGERIEQAFIAWSVARLNIAPTFVRSGAMCGVVRNGYSDPTLLGVDRWLAIIAAYQLVKQACIWWLRMACIWAAI
jgi:type III pantothenate kinase